MSNGTVTIINPHHYDLKQVPEVGKEYHIFDDGKIKPSRHYMAEVVEIIPFEKCEDLELISKWVDEVIECDWLFATSTDYFVKATSSYDAKPLYFVRTVDGGWFSLDYPDAWMGARLDVDGSLYEKMKEWYNVEE